MANFSVINVVHEEDGLFMNGTLSTLDGTPKVTWTFNEQGGEFTVDKELEEKEFDALWNLLNEPVFRRCRVQGMETELDFRRNYVVGVMFQMKGQTGRITHLVPKEEKDAVWVNWLKAVERTQKR